MKADIHQDQYGNLVLLLKPSNHIEQRAISEYMAQYANDQKHDGHDIWFKNVRITKINDIGRASSGYSTVMLRGNNK